MYKIHNKEFKNKTDIRTFLIDTIKESDNQPILGEKFDIISESVKNLLPIKRMNGEITEITGRKTGTHNEIYVFDITVYKLKYNRKKTYEYKTERVYVGTIVDYAPPVKETTINYVFKFGKYKGMNIEDVNDINYLYWITSVSSNLNKTDKALIKKFIKYGFIPYTVPY
jgi:hypothetical protein